jgi:dihydrofolate reductase
MSNLSAIVAVDRNYGIGRNNQLLCHLPADMKHFKETTSGHTVIMGRKTWDSLKIQPLPNRRNIIITNQKNLVLKDAEVAHSVDEAIALCANDAEAFIIGGDSIYKLCLPFVNRIYLTHIDATFEADTFFPKPDPSEWKTVFRETCQPDEKNAYPFSFETLERIGS